MLAPRILLVGDRETRPSCLSDCIDDWGPRCQFAFSRADVTVLVRAASFNLVLSRMRLPDGDAFQLIPLFKGRPTSLFSYLSAKDGCWWLPLLKAGAECERGPALHELEFMKMLRQTAVMGSEAFSRLAAHGAARW